MYFSSHQIPELDGLNFAERMSVVRGASDKLSVPKKLLLNLIKLAILFIFFMYIARAGDWTALLYIVGLIVAYPMITRPLTFMLCRPYFTEVRRALERQQQES
ncbi:MAG: DUF6170 family protein [Alkalimonas sp.]|nr:DUF6170 family protein [Alkalimonas sp.]